METKSLLYGIGGFLLGGLLVSVAATTFEKDRLTNEYDKTSMSQMTNDLAKVNGDEYDKLFIAHMIEHHQSAIDMARLSSGRAKHDEIKGLSSEIITAQEKEITEMKRWQQAWGYEGNHGEMQR